MITSITRRLAAALLALGLALPLAQAAPMVNGLGGSSGFGTIAMGRNDDGSSGRIALGSGFPYGIKLFTESFTQLYINNNGNLTFRAPLGTYTPTPFPVTNQPMLAAYWGDVDTRGGIPDPQNEVYFSTAVPGKFIVTWNYVGYYSGGTNKLNAFQMIITDRSDVAQGDFDLEYRYEQLQWTTGSASGGSNGLGGTPAQMGYDAGDGKNYYRHPDSATANILNLVSTSNVGEPGVWRFEVRGGKPNPVKIPTLVDVQLVQTLNAADIDIDMASFQTAPASVSSANGQTRIQWNFPAFPANISKDLSYEVNFRNPRAGEKRQLLAKTELQYKDVNGKLVHSELGVQEITVLPSIYTVAPSSDKPAYGANEPVLLSSVVRNLSAFNASAAVRLSVYDANNALVAVVGSTAPQAVAASGNTPYGPMLFSSGSLAPGGYRVLAEALDGNGAVAATGWGSFDIVGASGSQATAAIAADKASYGPFDRVQLTDRITNLLANASLDNVRITTVVTRPDGSQLFEKEDSLAQLAPGGSKSLVYPLQLAASPAGQYSAVLRLAKVDGTLLAQAATQFKVTSSEETGAGLAGTLQAAPALVHDGKAVALSFNVSNGGNSAINNVPLALKIIDPAAQRVVASYPYQASLAVGAAFPGTASWTAVGSDSGSYVAVLGATVGGKELVLAQQPIKVLKLEATASFKAGSRVLALVSCTDEEEEQADTNCEPARAQTIERILSAAGVEYLVATSEQAFKQAFRSGRFNTYWLSGKQDKLHGSLSLEVREAVFGGDGALVDSEHDQRNGVLDDMAGIRWKGKFGATELPVDLAGPLYTPQRLYSSGRSDRLELAGGSTQATLNVGGPHGDAPAIIGNTYGAGRVLQFAFDLPSSFSREGAWQPVIERSLQHVMRPLGDTQAPGASLLAKLGVRNLGPATAVLVSSALPAGAEYLSSAPDGTYDGDKHTVSWSFTLENQQAWDASLALRAPLLGADYSLATTVSTVDPSTGLPSQYGQPLALAVKVYDAEQLAQQAIATLNGLALSRKQDARLRDRMVDDVRAAMAGMQQGSAASLDAAIVQLVNVVAQLPQLGGVATRPVRDALDSVIREAQRRWSVKATQG